MKLPMVAYRAPVSGTLFFPQGMNEKEGFDTGARRMDVQWIVNAILSLFFQVRFRKGDDLNDIVYNHYDKCVDPKTWPTNCVDAEGIIAKRYVPGVSSVRSQYLGRHLASCRFTSDKDEIEWYDPYLVKTRIGDTHRFEESGFDETVRWWFPTDRSLYRESECALAEHSALGVFPY